MPARTVDAELRQIPKLAERTWLGLQPRQMGRWRTMTLKSQHCVRESAREGRRAPHRPARSGRRQPPYPLLRWGECPGWINMYTQTMHAFSLKIRSLRVLTIQALRPSKDLRGSYTVITPSIDRSGMRASQGATQGLTQGDRVSSRAACTAGKIWS